MSEKELLTLDRDGKPVKMTEYTELVDEKENKSQCHPSSRRQVLLLMGCCYLRFVCTGPGFALSVMYVEVIEHFQAPRTQASLIQSLYTVFLYGSSFVASLIMTKVGPGMSVACSAVLASTGFLLSSFLLNTNIAGVIVCTGVVSGFAMSVISTSVWTTAAWSFKEKKTFAILVSSCGSSFGMFVFPYIAEIALQNFQLQGAFIAIACVASTAIPVGMGIHSSRKYFDKGEQGKTGAWNFSFFRLPMFWISQLCVLLVSFSLMDPYVLVDMVVEYGFGRTKGATAEFVLGVAGIFGKLMSVGLTRITDLPTMTHWSYSCLVTGVSHLLLPHFHLYWLVIVVSVLSGISYGVSSAISGVVVLETVGLDSYPLAMGVSSVIWGTGSFVGISFCGSLKDAGWTYDDIFYVLTGTIGLLNVLCLAVAVYSRRKQ